MIVYPFTRHLQRYEYIVESRLVDDKVVADVGCGIAVGAIFMTSVAKMVYGIDPKLANIQLFGINGNAKKERFQPVADDLFNFKHKVDVVTAVEVFEHMPDPEKFIRHISSICDYAFLTTPLAEITGKSRNPEHVAEYSDEDFNKLVGVGFDIIEKRYQLATMVITDRADPCWDSLNPGHVVQMVWCRSRHEQREH